MILNKIKIALENAPHLWLFVGDGEPFYVINPVWVEKRKAKYLSEGKDVKIIKIERGSIGESLDDLIGSNEISDEPREKRKYTKKKINN